MVGRRREARKGRDDKGSRLAKEGRVKVVGWQGQGNTEGEIDDTGLAGDGK